MSVLPKGECRLNADEANPLRLAGWRIAAALSDAVEGQFSQAPLSGAREFDVTVIGFRSRTCRVGVRKYADVDQLSGLFAERLFEVFIQVALLGDPLSRALRSAFQDEHPDPRGERVDDDAADG